MYKNRKLKGFASLQILIIMFLIFFLATILVNLSICKLEKANMKTSIIENTLR